MFRPVLAFYKVIYVLCLLAYARKYVTRSYHTYYEMGPQWRFNINTIKTVIITTKI